LSSDLASLDETSAGQHAHVLGGAGEAHAIRCCKFAYGLLTERQRREHAAPGRVGECHERDVELMINHAVD
jgi:hypothetical protein